MKKYVVVALAAFLTLASAALAGDFHGWPLPEKLEEKNQTLVLNGAGFRTKFFLNVYIGALYLKEKSSDARTIIDADNPMGVRMHFTFKNVPKKKFLSTLEDGFAKSAKGRVGPIRERMDRLFSVLPEKFKKNDVLDLVYTPGRGVVMTLNGKHLTEVPGLDFKQAMVGIWLGDEPVTNKLKNEMLGLAGA